MRASFCCCYICYCYICHAANRQIYQATSYHCSERPAAAGDTGENEEEEDSFFFAFALWARKWEQRIKIELKTNFAFVAILHRSKNKIFFSEKKFVF
jgi:hypothetical protein